MLFSLSCYSSLTQVVCFLRLLQVFVFVLLWGPPPPVPPPPPPFFVLTCYFRFFCFCFLGRGRRLLFSGGFFFSFFDLFALVYFLFLCFSFVCLFFACLLVCFIVSLFVCLLQFCYICRCIDIARHHLNSNNQTPYLSSSFIIDTTHLTNIVKTSRVCSGFR